MLSAQQSAVELARRYSPQHLFIEDKASGEALIQFLRKELPAHLWPLPRNPSSDKVNRATGVSPIVENGRLFLPTESVWLGEFKAELLGFPNVRYLDQVDALSQMLEWVRMRDAVPMPTENAGPELIECELDFVERRFEHEEDYGGLLDAKTLKAIRDDPWL